jgi:hypothetical protein
MCFQMSLNSFILGGTDHKLWKDCTIRIGEMGVRAYYRHSIRHQQRTACSISDKRLLGVSIVSSDSYARGEISIVQSNAVGAAGPTERSDAAHITAPQTGPRGLTNKELKGERAVERPARFLFFALQSLARAIECRNTFMVRIPGLGVCDGGKPLVAPHLSTSLSPRRVSLFLSA